ncbi:hypothetical protein BDW74DRAFT_47723 [Aspergillus multicolor]|uniref:uncharacterized protein n=1 Tax=Aspergillus multicolor TaxID=41759 RepID=UPI003CCE0D9F
MTKSDDHVCTYQHPKDKLHVAPCVLIIPNRNAQAAGSSALPRCIPSLAPCKGKPCTMRRLVDRHDTEHEAGRPSSCLPFATESDPSRNCHLVRFRKSASLALLVFSDRDSATPVRVEDPFCPPTCLTAGSDGRQLLCPCSAVCGHASSLDLLVGAESPDTGDSIYETSTALAVLARLEILRNL